MMVWMFWMNSPLILNFSYHVLNVFIKFATNFVIYCSLYFYESKTYDVLNVLNELAPNFLICCSLYFRRTRLIMFWLNSPLIFRHCRLVCWMKLWSVSQLLTLAWHSNFICRMQNKKKQKEETMFLCRLQNQLLKKCTCFKLTDLIILNIFVSNMW